MDPDSLRAISRNQQTVELIAKIAAAGVALTCVVGCCYRQNECFQQSVDGGVAQCKGCIAGQGGAGAPEVQGQGLQEPFLAGGNDFHAQQV